jgi:hypothetical protein
MTFDVASPDPRPPNPRSTPSEISNLISKIATASAAPFEISNLQSQIATALAAPLKFQISNFKFPSKKQPFITIYNLL